MTNTSQETKQEKTTKYKLTKIIKSINEQVYNFFSARLLKLRPRNVPREGTEIRDELGTGAEGVPLTPTKLEGADRSFDFDDPILAALK